MHRYEGINGFYLDDDKIIDDKIDAISGVQPDILENHGEFFLPYDEVPP